MTPVRLAGATNEPELDDRRRDAHVAAVAHITGEAVAMANSLDLAMLVLASLGALAFGILSAYAILRVGFALMRAPSRPALVKAQPEAARTS
jgi:hypothetical protein